MSNDITPGKPLRVYRENGEFQDFSTDEIVGKRLNYYRNWKCGAGSKNIHIDMDGNIYAASCKVGGKLGNVYEDFETPETWITCNVDICSCGADLFVPKMKSMDHESLLRKTSGLDPKGKKVDSISTPDEQYAMERTFSSNVKQVYWEIGRRCNFDCSYCWPWIHNNHERHKSLEELISATQLVEEKFCRGSKANFVISGGEPTMNPAFMDWVRYIKAFGHYISMHSNASRQPDYYRELVHLSDINFSAHFEFYNRDKFIKNIAAIVDEKVKSEEILGHLEVKLMMKPGDRAEALKLELELKKIPSFTDYCTWAVVPIRDGNKGDTIMEGYEEADYEMFGDRK